MSVQIIPENAPFTPEQRAWLNGFIAGLMGLQGIAGAPPANTPLPAAAPAAGDEPWHDETLPLEERMKLAEGRSYPQRLMAAMGQMDCGQCGYLCRTYAQAIAGGQESDLTLCVPGGKTTARQLKLLVREGGATPASAPAAKTEVLHTRKNPFTARLKAVVPLTRAGSVKDIRHVAIDLSGSGIRYQPGDSLGVLPRNCPDLVAAILQRLGASGGEMVETPAGPRPLRQALIEDLDITRPSDEAIE
nr:sulfite reductase subunit alpha [Pseudomonadota bacterium]